MSVCAAPTCSHQSFDGSSYYVDVDVDVDIIFILISQIENNTFKFIHKYNQILYPMLQ